VRDRESFVEPTLALLRDAVGSAGNVGQRFVCREECALRTHGAHEHTLFDVEGEPVELTSQPFHWGADVLPRRPPVVGWWVFRAALAVTLLQLISPWGVFVRRARWGAKIYRKYRRRAIWGAILFSPVLASGTFLLAFALIGWLIWLVLRASVIFVGGVVALVLIPLYGGLVWVVARAWPGRARQLWKPMLRVNDALVWCSDDNFRNWVVAQCTARIEVAEADHCVLIGHSQGGSILTEWTREADLERNSATLLTFGSGQGLLATLHEALRGWRVLQSFFATLAVLLFVAATIFLARTFAVSTPSVVPMLRTARTLLQASWLGNLVRDDYLSSAAEASAEMARSSNIAVLELLTGDSEPPAEFLFAGFVFSVVTILLFAAVLTVIGPLARPILDRCATGADGMDISATHDPISKPLHVLGGEGRLRRLPQTGSMALDHVRYASNRIAVWPAIEATVRDALQRKRFDNESRATWDRAHFAELYEHQAELGTLRNLRVIAAILAILPIVALLSPGIHDYLAAAAAGAVAIATWCAATLRGAYLLERNSALASNGMLGEIARRRMSRRSIPRAFGLGIVALSLFGALMLPADLGGIVRPTSIVAVEVAQVLANSGFFIGMLAALMFVRGSLLARPIAFAAIAFAVLGWLALGSEASRIWWIGTAVLGAVITFSPLFHARAKGSPEQPRWSW
jgi:hypothetical protein